MERVKRSLWFWALVLIAIALPATAQTPIKKILFKAQITVGNLGKGAGLITAKPYGWDYAFMSHAYPDRSVTKVSLRPNNDAWEVIVCENGALAGDCKYDTDGNLYIEGAVTDTMLILAGINGKIFHDTLRDEKMYGHYNGGALGSGLFRRIF